MLEVHRSWRDSECGAFMLSARFSHQQRAALERWLQAAPKGFISRLPAIRIAAARLSEAFEEDCVHAGSFIPQGYLVLGEELLSSPGELGRILFHELCHFLWPRLRRGRVVYEAALLREATRGTTGELGLSAAASRADLPRRVSDPARLAPRLLRCWRYYLCESFCDTGSYVLLRRSGNASRHPEWTLPVAARAARESAWLDAAGLGSQSKV